MASHLCLNVCVCVCSWDDSGYTMTAEKRKEMLLMGLPDDGYDYLRHLKAIATGGDNATVERHDTGLSGAAGQVSRHSWGCFSGGGSSCVNTQPSNIIKSMCSQFDCLGLCARSPSTCRSVCSLWLLLQPRTAIQTMPEVVHLSGQAGELGKCLIVRVVRATGGIP